MNYVRIRYKVILATETFAGQYHAGGAGSQNYEIAIPMGIYQDSAGEISWAQEPDARGHIDPRLPAGGAAEIVDGDLVLTHFVGRVPEAVGTLVTFIPETAQGRGLATFAYMQRKTYTAANPANPASRTDWRGRGTWEVLDRKWAPAAATDYVFSNWTFKTSGGGGGGILLAASGGEFVLTDPGKRDWEFFYGGIGLGGGLKGATIKGVRIPLQVPVGNARVGTGTMSGSGSLTAFRNAGKVLKSPLWVGARELTPDDFTGTCLWADGAAVVVGGAGGAMMFLGINPLLLPLMNVAAARATVVSIGITGGLGVGGGGYIGRVWGAW